MTEGPGVRWRDRRAFRWGLLLSGSFLAGLLAIAVAILWPGGFQEAPVVPGASPGADRGDRSATGAAPRQPAGAAAPGRAPSPSARGPRLAVVVDDFGYDPAGDAEWLALPGKATFAVIPFGPSSRRIAESARARGFAVLLHVPMEPEAPAGDRTEGFRLRRGMDQGEMAALLSRMIEDVPGARGASNHMGSAFTADAAAMTAFAALLGTRGLYLLDSVTTPRSVAVDAARAAGVPAARRDLLVDAGAGPEEIRRRWDRAVALAREKGRAILVCHASRETFRFLIQALPALPGAGVRAVTTDELIGDEGG